MHLLLPLRGGIAPDVSSRVLDRKQLRIFHMPNETTDRREGLEANDTIRRWIALQKTRFTEAKGPPNGFHVAGCLLVNQEFGDGSDIQVRAGKKDPTVIRHQNVSP